MNKYFGIIFYLFIIEENTTDKFLEAVHFGIQCLFNKDFHYYFYFFGILFSYPLQEEGN